MKTRNGKIARLPKEVREQLNRRLENGWGGAKLVEWLNDLPAVREVLLRLKEIYHLKPKETPVHPSQFSRDASRRVAVYNYPSESK